MLWRPSTMCCVALVGACGDGKPDVLVYSRTNGHRHEDAIAAATAALPAAVPELELRFSEDPMAFYKLDDYEAVIFLYTSGNDVLDEAGKAALETFVRDGGGWLGIHSAADTEYLWPFYGRLVVAYFEDHPGIQPATMTVERAGHEALTDVSVLPWEATDEWYNFRSNPRLTGGVVVLATIDESTYTGGTMGDHPMIWAHENLGGRALYTELGHVADRWSEPNFVQHITSGLRWVIRRD
jgi:type 1 glutamine amidotransferase